MSFFTAPATNSATGSSGDRSQPEENILDNFGQPRSRGKVIGGHSPSRQYRHGADIEKRLSIDNGALRIQPLVHPGWGRAGIAYGPYQRQAGLALSIFMLNGHNTSEGNSIEETLKGRIFRWVRGSEANPISNRLRRWAMSPHHRQNIGQFYRWIRNHKGRFKQDYIKDNLALGWFPEPVPADPTAVGNSIVIRANGPENGELWTRQGDRLTPTLQGLQNLQTYYLVVLRETGAAYYAAAIPDAHGLSGFPYMRLIGIDPHNSDHSSSGNEVYAGLYQSALGQVGFRVDTRVYGMQAAVLPELSAWYGTAQMADTLTGSGDLNQTAAILDGHWRVVEGSLRRTAQGLAASAPDSHLALLDMAAPAGALHMMVTSGENLAACGLLWRTQDEKNSWGLFFESGQCELKICEQGQWAQVAVDSTRGLLLKTRARVQILDDGQTFSLYLNGVLLFDRWFVESRFQDQTGVGLAISGGDNVRFQQLEVHPRNIPIPPALKLGTPWQAQGAEVFVSERFDGPIRELAGKPVEKGTGHWRKELGRGRIMLTGKDSARVDGSAQQPNPGRLAYTVDWVNPDLADLSVDVMPPGTDRRQGEKGRGGLIFWQDPDHYITISHWLDDTYGGASLSSFFHISGFEEIYDAVWTNVGKRVLWGKRHRLRVVFDGMNFLAYIDGEPVLYRALSDVYPQVKRLSIQRVGIVANWEWGNDTGSVFSRFVAKA